MAIYNAYRIFITQSEDQPSLFDGNVDKVQAFKDILERIKSKDKDSFIIYNAIHYLIFKKMINNNIYLFTFVKEERTNTPKLIGNDIQIISDYRHPNHQVFIDIETQILLIDSHTAAFDEMETAIDRLRYYFQKSINKISNANFNIRVNQIFENKEFWKEVSESEKIYSLELIFNEPNLFGGDKEASAFVKEVHQQTDFNEFRIEIYNRKGNLNLIKKNFADWINLIASGAGKFRMRVLQKNSSKAIKLRSEDTAQKEVLPDNTELIDDSTLKKIIEKLDKMNSYSAKKSRKDGRRGRKK